MANYTAADVKKLREATGAGMMNCKNALEEANGDHEKAVELLRLKGLKGVAKREGRDASNGLVAAHTESGAGVLVELNCETDFVAKGDKFQALADQVLQVAVASKATSTEELLAATEADGKTVTDILNDANAQIGEKIVLGRVGRVEAPSVVQYLHRTMPDLPPQIGVLVGLTAENNEAGRGVAMHAAAMAPRFLSRDEVPADAVAKEREILETKAKEDGRPEHVLGKIVEGQLASFFADTVLLDQAYAKEPKKKVAEVLKEAGVEATAMKRFRVGS